MGKRDEIQEARDAVDEAIDVWLRASGLSDRQIMDIDYSSVSDEIDGLLNDPSLDE